MIIIIILKQSHDYLINQVTKIKSIIFFRRELKVYMETKQKTLVIYSILSSHLGLLLALFPPDKLSSFTSIKCIEYTIVSGLGKKNLLVAQQFHHPFFSTKKKKIQKQFQHPLYHNFCQASVNIICVWSFSFVANVHSMDP